MFQNGRHGMYLLLYNIYFLYISIYIYIYIVFCTLTFRQQYVHVFSTLAHGHVFSKLFLLLSNVVPVRFLFAPF